MTVTNSFAVADAKNNALEAAVGTSPIIRAYTGVMPTNARTALSGNTVIAEGTLPSDWMANSSNGVKAKAGTWTLTGLSAAGAGTAATFYRIYESTGTTCHEQGTWGAATALSTSAATAANSNVLTFASAPSVAQGQKITGTGILEDTVALAVSGNTVLMSRASTAGVASGASITFGSDITVDTNSIANGQSVTIGTYQKTAGNL
jgi:hypothetical protein